MLLYFDKCPIHGVMQQQNQNAPVEAQEELQENKNIY